MLHRFPFRAMGSPCELQLHGDDADAVAQTAQAAIGEVLRIERKYSRYRDDSVTAEINRHAGAEAGLLLDDESAALIDYAETAFEQSDGAFDITSGVLRQAWDFRSGRIPSLAEVERALARVGWDRARWEGGRLRLAEGQEIDFGGLGKEYAADRAAQICRELGVRAGIVDLSGDIAVVGSHPDSTPWIVGVRDPKAPGAIASVSLDRGAIATSGDYQRCMVVAGRRYAHILDPRTGWPVEGLTSVSVIAEQCLIAGTASTIAMLKGRDGASWLDTLGLPNLCIDSAGRLGGTLAASATSSRPDSSGYGEAPSMRSAGFFATLISPGSTTT